MTTQATANVLAPTFQPTETQVDQLIHDAESHDLGVDFLLEGSLDSVAATFSVHAFTIEAARDRLSD